MFFLLFALLGVSSAWVALPSTRPLLRRRWALLSSVTTTTEGGGLSPTSRPEYVPGKISDPGYVRIFDTTLRDGEQSPGATLTSSEKLEIARALSKAGVDIIEAGFPVASPDDFEAVRRIARTVGNEVREDGYVPVICGLSRANTKDIQRAWDAVKLARYPRIHTFIATSEVHMKSKLRKTPDEVVDTAVKAVTFARDLGCDDVEFSPEDAGRSDPEFLERVIAAVADAGATTINIPDTTGWNMPWEFGSLLERLVTKFQDRDLVFSTHCQNDLGLATANSLAGARMGARQIECTINGIGERAGNAALEEVVCALKLKGDGLRTAVDSTTITPTSRLVAQYTGMAVQPHKAIVGANAFRHESGIHQDGMIKNKETYEIMTPESVGLGRVDGDVGIVLGKHSGRNAVATRLRELGYADVADDAERFAAVFTRFKEVAEKKKGGLEDDDLEALVADEVFFVAKDQDVLWDLVGVQVTTGSNAVPTATLTMAGPDGLRRVAANTGTGPVDAVYKAIDALTGVAVDLESYDLEAVTAGIDALATTRVVVTPKPGSQLESSSLHASGAVAPKRFSGSGADTDVVVSSARAYLAAINKLLSWNKTRKQRDLENNNNNNNYNAKSSPPAGAPTQNDDLVLAPSVVLTAAATTTSSQPVLSKERLRVMDD